MTEIVSSQSSSIWTELEERVQNFSILIPLSGTRKQISTTVENVYNYILPLKAYNNLYSEFFSTVRFDVFTMG